MTTPAVQFTPEQDEAIFASGLTGRALADRFGIPLKTIYKRRWRLRVRFYEHATRKAATAERDHSGVMLAQEIAALEARVAITLKELAWLREQISIKTHCVTTK